MFDAICHVPMYGFTMSRIGIAWGDVNMPKLAKSSNPARGLEIILSGLLAPTTFPPTTSVSVVFGSVPKPKNCATLPPTVLGCSNVGAIT